MIEQMVAMKDIAMDTNRKYGGEGDIRILAEDMKVNELINPITLMPKGRYVDAETGRLADYEIVAGRRRFVAAKILGWDKIRANVLEPHERERAEAIAGSENINRLAMHPLDEAQVFHRLMENGESIENLAKRYDRSKSAIWQRMQLLYLSDGIKDLFRQGIISLHAAAMLKNLSVTQQEVFYRQFSERSQGSVQTWEVECFLARIYHDKLYKCVAGKECSTCAKRTYYSDKELFPELHTPNDTCLDHECYMEKWKKLLLDRIKSVKGEHADHAGANIIIIGESQIRQLFGKSVTLADSVEYTVKPYIWDALADKPGGKNTLHCLYLEMSGENLKVAARYWKEPKKEKSETYDTHFVPMMKLLDMPKEEAEQINAGLKAKSDNIWDINHKAYNISVEVRRKVFSRILESKAKQEADNDKDIEYYLADWLKDDDNKEIAKMFVGAADVKSLRALSWPKLFAALNASKHLFWKLPDAWEVVTAKKNDAAEWAGLSMPELKEIYKEELRPLMPKPKPAGKPKKGKPAKGKKAKKEKPGAEGEDNQ